MFCRVVFYCVLCCIVLVCCVQLNQWESGLNAHLLASLMTGSLCLEALNAYQKEVGTISVHHGILESI